MAERPRVIVVVGILAVAIAAVAAYFLYTYLKGEEQRVSQAVASEQIVVASQEIPMGSTINILQVKKTNWPKASIPEGAFISTDQLVGRVAVQTIVPGDPVIESKLVPKEGKGVLTYKIPEGHRAMTVAVDQVAGVAGFINPGDMVDVVLTTTPPGGTMAISKIVLQYVPVLAIGQIIENREGKAVVVPTVTTDVTPVDAEKLAIASSQGKLQLVLRRAGDKDITKTAGATVNRVISGSTASVATPRTVAKANVAAPRKEEPRISGDPVEIWR